MPEALYLGSSQAVSLVPHFVLHQRSEDCSLAHNVRRFFYTDSLAAACIDGQEWADCGRRRTR